MNDMEFQVNPIADALSIPFEINQMLEHKKSALVLQPGMV